MAIILVTNHVTYKYWLFLNAVGPEKQGGSSACAISTPRREKTELGFRVRRVWGA